MRVQVDPNQLRFLANRFSSGLQEILLKSTRLENIMNELVQGSWKGEGAHAFAINCELIKGEMQKTAEVLDRAVNTLNRFANQMERVNQMRQQAEMLEQQSWQYSGDSIDDLHHRQNLARQAAQLRQEADWEANAADSQASSDFNMFNSMIPQLLEHVNSYLGSRSNTGELDDLPEPMRSYYLRYKDLLGMNENETAATITMGSYKQADYQGVSDLERRHDELVSKAKEILRKRDAEGYITDPDQVKQIVEQSFAQECGDLTDEELETFIHLHEESDSLNQEMQQKRLAGEDITKEPNYLEYLSSQGMVEPTLISTEGITSAATGRLFGKLSVDPIPEEFEGLQAGYYADPNSETSVKNITRQVSVSASQEAQNWQGKYPYVGVDKYRDVTLKKGKVIYVGEPYPTGYATTESGLKRAGNDATKVFEGVQVKPYHTNGMNSAEYRAIMMPYEVTEDVAAAFGIAKANPQFGQGGLPQLYLPQFEDLLKAGKIRPLPEKAIQLENTSVSLESYLDMMNKISPSN